MGLKRRGSVGKAWSYRDMGLELDEAVSSSLLPMAAATQREKIAMEKENACRTRNLI